MIELLRVQKDKRALKFAKKRVRDLQYVRVTMATYTVDFVDVKSIILVSVAWDTSSW